MTQPIEVFVHPKDLILPSGYEPDKQRLDELIASVKENGRLLHSPCIKEDKTVIAGKLRVLAVRGVLDIIKCEQYPNNLTADEYKSISLHENLMRMNLPWNEIILYEKELHELRMRQAGEDSRGQRGRRAAWGLRDTDRKSTT